MTTLVALLVFGPALVGCGLASGSLVLALRDANRDCRGYF